MRGRSQELGVRDKPSHLPRQVPPMAKTQDQTVMSPAIPPSAPSNAINGPVACARGSYSPSEFLFALLPGEYATDRSLALAARIPLLRISIFNFLFSTFQPSPPFRLSPNLDAREALSFFRWASSSRRNLEGSTSFSLRPPGLPPLDLPPPPPPPEGA